MFPELGPLPQWVFVGGKGGVGKTTVAASLAISLADAGEPTVVLSTDPAHSLGDALGVTLVADPIPVHRVPRLRAMEVDAARERRSFLAQYGAALRELLSDATFLDEADLDSLLDLPVPGIDELGALWRLAQIRDSEERLVIDTAPTGHTLRMLHALAATERWLDSLLALRARHRLVRERLGSGAPAADAVDDQLGSLREALVGLRDRLRDGGRSGFVLVTLPEPVVLAETDRYRRELDGLGVRVVGLVVNRAGPAASRRTGHDVGAVARRATVRPEPVGPDGLRRFARARARTGPDREARAGAAGGEIAAGESYAPPDDRGLYLVAGKGGVGKTTVASALALDLCRTLGEEVLLLSVDPAGSLGDVWEVGVGDEARPVPGERRLRLRQLDVARAWAAFRERVLADPEGGAADLPESDRVVELVRELVDAAPPGIDELVGVLEVVELLEMGSYAAIVLDTAPTGHFLRLIEAPEAVLEWTHAVMRLLLRYREVIGLGRMAENLLSLSRRVRELRDRLGSPPRRFVCLVTLCDALNVPEAERLVAALRERGIGPDLLVLNRSPPAGEADREAEERSLARRLMALARPAPAIAAGERAESLVGVDALARFSSEWRTLAADVA